MDYRFSPLPRCFTMHPVYRHQIFSALWLELMHRSPPAESRLLISERKLGFNNNKKKKLNRPINQSGKAAALSFDFPVANLED